MSKSNISRDPPKAFAGFANKGLPRRCPQEMNYTRNV